MSLVLIFLTGIAWGGIGLVLGRVSRRKQDGLSFMALAMMISSAAAWVFLPKWKVLLAGEIQSPLPLVVVLCVAGAAGGCGILWLQRAMTAGAAAWTVGQSAMVIPFLVGVLLLGDSLRLVSGIGVVMILLSLLAFYRGESRKGRGKQCWMRSALIAFAFLGTQQTLSSIPSSWEGWSDAANIRAPLVLTSGALPLVFLAWRRSEPVARGAYGQALGYATLVVAGQALLFKALDLLGAEGRLSLAFPLALGTCIVLVSLWDLLVRRVHFERVTLAGMALGATGVVLLAVR